MADHVAELLEAVIGREGRYSNDPRDRGGETMWGITAAVARAYGYQGAMRDLPRATALDILRRRYWQAPGFEALAMVDPWLGERLLDIGVNMGPSVGVRWLQRALNALNRQGADYPEVAVDGGLGRLTLAAVRAFYAARGNDGRRVLRGMVAAQHAVAYLGIAEGDPSQEAFLYGWELNRALGASLGDI